MLDVEGYLSRHSYSDSQIKEIRAFAESLSGFSEDEYLRRASKMIWLSAYAESNPRSAYHPMCDLCYDEAERRGDTDLYDRAFRKATGL